MRERIARMPVELRVVALVVFGAGLVFLALGAILLAVDPHATPASLQPPATAALLGFAVAVGLLFRMRLVWGITVVIVVVFALLHLVIVFSQGQWFARLGSGVLAAGYIYAGVLVNTGPARDYLRGLDA
ncbi:hypothetical protein EV191_111163 [Tamaricihabitans halophyticus]|uniref:Uncharacterized protein n=1 Tax=Tamaricihabitans halophyticus TaxID=1262583 RepID=A0A4R2QHV2_9PSEU|nr:hypothetical protein [Tamaricihabitans halophyticus]TCP47958.1 hypothetical protein EV191_111163 [Tamaricihabitans halophyticus]